MQLGCLETVLSLDIFLNFTHSIAHTLTFMEKAKKAPYIACQYDCRYTCRGWARKRVVFVLSEPVTHDQFSAAGALHTQKKLLV